MPADTSSQSPPDHSNLSTAQDMPIIEPWGWNRRQRIALGLLLLILLAFLAIQYARRPSRLEDRAVVVEGHAIILPRRIDPNTASVQDLSRIPHLGETLAGKIVDYREARRSLSADGIIFRQPSDLDGVPGIGKKLIDQMLPFLQFPDDTSVPAP